MCFNVLDFLKNSSLHIVSLVVKMWSYLSCSSIQSSLILPSTSWDDLEGKQMNAVWTCAWTGFGTFDKTNDVKLLLITLLIMVSGTHHLLCILFTRPHYLHVSPFTTHYISSLAAHSSSMPLVWLTLFAKLWLGFSTTSDNNSTPKELFAYWISSLSSVFLCRPLNHSLLRVEPVFPSTPAAYGNTEVFSLDRVGSASLL